MKIVVTSVITLLFIMTATLRPSDAGIIHEAEEDQSHRLISSTYQSYPTMPFQADPFITRPALVSAHTKWLYCSSAFWVLGDQCEKTQKFVPFGYWFETGRQMPNGTDCEALTGDGDVEEVETCKVKKGLTMVLPVVNTLYVGCDDQTGALEDPRLAPFLLWKYVACGYHKVHKATLDGKDISPLDLQIVMTQDGDMKQQFSGDPSCIDYNNNQKKYKNCPVGGLGPYVFIDTKTLKYGKHELLLIGSASDGEFCSAVKHKFTIV